MVTKTKRITESGEDLRFVESDAGLLIFRLSAFDASYEKLEKYKEKHGHCNVPETRVNRNGTGPRTEEGKLGSWVHALRSTKCKQKLTADQIRRLDSIGFDWNPLETVWNGRFEELKAFKKEFGHCDVPQSYKNKKLGVWVSVQRTTRFGNQRKSEIDPEKIGKLDSVGFIWNPKEYQYELNFQEGIKQLENYIKENGHCEISKTLRFGTGARLLNFIQTMRRSLKQNMKESDKSPFSHKHINALNKIGFAWDARESKWEKNFQDLLKFKEQHGHCDVPAKWSPEQEHLPYNDRTPHPLGAWVSVQRVWRKQNTLSKEYTKRLNSVGFNWNRKEQFADKLLQENIDIIQRIRNHEKKYGNLNVMAEKDKKLRLQFEKDKRLLFKLRRQRDGRSAKTQHADIIIAEVDKRLKTWEWVVSEYLPEIKKIGKTYRVTITINKETKIYRREDPKRLEEMRDEVLKAGHHIKFPRPLRKGKDAPGWGKKKYVWTKDETKILKKNWKSMTDEQISKLLKTQSAFSVKLQRLRLGLIKSFALCTELRGEQKVLQSSCPKTGRFIKKNN